MKKLKKMDYIQLFILCLPFIDFITSICTWNKVPISIGLLIKGIFLIYAIIYLIKHLPNKKIFLFIGIYFIIYFVHLLMGHMSLVAEITNIVKIFYLPFLILFFSNIENEHITKRTLTIVLLFYLLLYIIPFFFGLGHNISEIYPNKELYLSYFYVGNELSNVVILLLPIALVYLLESNNYLLKAFYALLILIAIVLISTKTFYISIILILLYVILINRKKMIGFIKKNYLISLVTTLVIVLCLAVYLPKMDLTKNIKASLDHYEVTSLSDLLTYDNIDNVIFSSRLTFLENVHQEYQRSDGLEKLLGIGRVKVENIKNVEIDVFDIFYSIGIIGTFFYIAFFIYVLKNTHLQKIYKFSFILLIIISCFTGHVLLSPFTSTFLAVLFLVSKNDKGHMKKDILMVSNMYPSKQYPHYGIFVKNSYEVLQESKLEVDLVVMYKTNGKLKKFMAYVKVCGISLLKALFNNYDYIYVHFVSHTTAGVIIPAITSKNTKLVLNPHGNDIVADTDVDARYLKLSRLFLKFADVVISPSKYFKMVLEKEYNIPKNKIVVYPAGGVNTDKFFKKDKKEAKKNVGLKENIKYFGFVARIAKDKGYDTLILAINELQKKKVLKDIKFLMVGSGPEEPILDEMIAKYKLESKIIRKPLVAQDELVDIFNSLEALIYPTRMKSESLGLTGLEAMACETLVIGSNKYGPSDYLKDEVNSITFNPYDEKELVEKIETVLKMKEKAKKELTKEARKSSEEYSFNKTKKKLIQVFK